MHKIVVMVGLVNLVAVVTNGHYQPVAIENLGTNILPIEE
jgi:hypothetical protein